MSAPPEVGESQSGNYLAALVAGADRDTTAAATYFREALRADPRNPELLERAFAAALANGNMPDAFELSDRLLLRDSNNSLARLALAVHAIGDGQYGDAGKAHDVTTTLLTAWCYAGLNDGRDALATLDRIRDPSFAVFRDYHAGLIADLTGNAPEAARRLKAAYDGEKNTLRLVDAYARYLARHGDRDGAKQLYQDFAHVLPHHPLVDGALADLAAGRPLDPVIRNSKDGAAEVLYGLGGAGSRQGDELAALIYLRLALYLRPDHALAAVTVADLYEQLKQNQAAIAAYEMVPAGSPMRESADIQAGLSLDALGRSDEALKRLQEIVANNPRDVDALSALGSLQRSAIFVRSASSAPSNGPRPRRTSRRRSSCFPISRWCSTISAIPGSIRASISTRRSRCCVKRSTCGRPTAMSSTASDGPITSSAITTRRRASSKRRSN
jgi:tetratricopeptide (TPR) repeat protein